MVSFSLLGENRHGRAIAVKNKFHVNASFSQQLQDRIRLQLEIKFTANIRNKLSTSEMLVFS